MALTPYTAATDIIENLGTNPEDRTTLTDETFKAKFDENAANIKAFLNALIGELASTATGKGASAIGVHDAGELITATTVEAALAELAGTGRTTESLKSLADMIAAIKGEGWTNETLKGLADLLSNHEALKAAAAVLGHIKAGAGVSIDGNGALTAPVMKIGSFTRDISTASGTQAITGVGFTPRAVIFLSGVNFGQQMSIGLDMGMAAGAYVIGSMNAAAAGHWLATPAASIYFIAGESDNCNGRVQSFDSDGFTVIWTKNGSPTGTGQVYYLAIK
jgi:hypothetical protein